MKISKLFTILAISLFGFTASATAPVTSIGDPSASVTLIANNRQKELVLIKWFVKLTPKEYGKIRGKKLNFFEKIAFRMMQNKMKLRIIKAEGDETEKFNWKGFALGLILGPLGVLGNYLFSKDQSLRKWSWWGLTGWLLIMLIIFNGPNYN